MSPEAMLVALAMRQLAHTADTDALAEALVAETRTWDEVTMAVGVIHQESRGRNNIEGDCRRVGAEVKCFAKCAMQIWYAPRAVLTSPRLCVRIGMERLRASWKLCPTAPLAAYAGRACWSEGAVRVSRDRWRIGLAALRRVGAS